MVTDKKWDYEWVEITDALKQILISEDGEINHFDTIAENLMSDSVESVQIAPDGIVTDIYPAEGNEAGKDWPVPW